MKIQELNETLGSLLDAKEINLQHVTNNFDEKVKENISELVKDKAVDDFVGWYTLPIGNIIKFIGEKDGERFAFFIAVSGNGTALSGQVYENPKDAIKEILER